MKKLAILLSLFIIISFSLSSCGEDGSDGDAYLKISYSGSRPYSYWDNNPSIPYGFSYGTYYLVDPGSYNYRYSYPDGRTWTGTYTISVNSGKKGSLFSDGKDGEDRYYTFTCSYSGSSFSYYKNGKTITANTPDEDGIIRLETDRFILEISNQEKSESNSGIYPSKN